VLADKTWGGLVAAERIGGSQNHGGGPLSCSFLVHKLQNGRVAKVSEWLSSVGTERRGRLEGGLRLFGGGGLASMDQRRSRSVVSEQIQRPCSMYLSLRFFDS
jgi:hypothetical protein